MNVFVINSGSSSIKYQLIRMPDAVVICSGIVDRIGLDSSTIEHKTFHLEKEQRRKESIPVHDHATGL
jgi:acetate kinase